MKTYSRIREQGTQETFAGNATDRIVAIRQVVTEKQYAVIDGTMAYLFIASLVLKIYDALKPENQLKYASLSYGRMVQIALQLTK